MNAPTKNKKNIWRISLLKAMLRNEMYTGIRYYNTMRRIREYANPIHDIKHSSSKLLRTDRSEWIGVPVPVIIPKELFDKAKERRDWNKIHYRNPKKPQILSGMMRCGCCGSSTFSYRRFYVDNRTSPPTVHHRIAYKCNYKHRLLMHAKGTPMKKCTNKEIKSDILENYIFSMIKELLINHTKLRDHVDLFKRRIQANQLKIEKQLIKIEETTRKINISKKRIIDMYASGEIEKESYVLKNLEYDNELNKMKLEKTELLKKIPLLHKKEVIDTSIRQYCEGASIRLEKCDDFDSKRQFLQDYIEKVVYWDNKVELHGFVPVKLKISEGKETNTELAKIEFCIKDTIPNRERIGNRNAYGSSKPITMSQHDQLAIT